MRTTIPDARTGRTLPIGRWTKQYIRSRGTRADLVPLHRDVGAAEEDGAAVDLRPHQVLQPDHLLRPGAPAARRQRALPRRARPAVSATPALLCRRSC